MTRRLYIFVAVFLCITATFLVMWNPIRPAKAFALSSGTSSHSLGNTIGTSNQVLSSSAVGTTSTEAIVRGRTTTIPANELVEDVLVLGHNVTVQGRVSEILVVLDGNVHLARGSSTHLVLDLGGTITQDPGAHVRAMYHLSLNTPFWNGALFGLTAALLAWGGMLVVSVGLIILSVLLSFTLRSGALPLGNQDKSVRWMGLLGFLVSVAVVAISSVFALSVLGIPLAAIVAVLYLVLGIVGFAMTSLWMGRLALRSSQQDRPYYVTALVGSILLTAFINIPFIGLLFFALMWFVGIGAATTWLRDSWRLIRRRRRQT